MTVGSLKLIPQLTAINISRFFMFVSKVVSEFKVLFYLASINFVIFL